MSKEILRKAGHSSYYLVGQWHQLCGSLPPLPRRQVSTLQILQQHLSLLWGKLHYVEILSPENTSHGRTLGGDSEKDEDTASQDLGSTSPTVP